ncbi:alpha-L-fucosidase [Neorhodopirellula lusitana]|uniref:alpha-L-fucosidase n=1 Tax=Neorhodopirellula lusitana TaxID=445327 RepID=A0ABY1QH84_9BACT|nr:alpha-L-fucosidase [Neorhodopirellula lusitana]SMP69570.1 alpha-L-fucosidase [Neorhodopirellula lusitana]
MTLLRPTPRHPFHAAIAIGFALTIFVSVPFASPSSAENPTSEFTPKDYPQEYSPTWDSLSQHPIAPKWLDDAKLGIYFHWGPYSVPAFKTEWYPRWIHMSNPKKWGAGSQEYHEANYGPIEKFGYHHFIPMFTAEHFDPAEWAELFDSAGARFAGPVAQHHDGFSMWDSQVNPNNAKAEGPQRDITGELLAELRKRDMKTITTFHHSFTGQRQRDGQPEGERPLSYYRYDKDLFTSTDDPKLRKLYGNMPEGEFNEYWLSLVQEVVDKYSPDLIWFDSWLDVIPEDYRQRMAAHHFNAAAARNQNVALIAKQEDMPNDVRLLDIEQGGMKEMPERLWMTDITLSTNGWCFVQNQRYKPLDLLVRNMIDVWSKRGVVLLNISPKSDGVIIDEQRTLLKGLGDWMKMYGEAVYNTRPHTIYGYGEAAIRDGSHGGQAATIKYSAKDIRFTRSQDGKTIYAFLLGQPKPGDKIAIQHLLDGSNSDVSIADVTVLGGNPKCEWTVQDGVLNLVAPPATDANKIATVFKVQLQ